MDDKFEVGMVIEDDDIEVTEEMLKELSNGKGED